MDELSNLNIIKNGCKYDVESAAFKPESTLDLVNPLVIARPAVSRRNATMSCRHILSPL